MITGILSYFDGPENHKYFCRVWESMLNKERFSLIPIHVCRWHMTKTITKKLKELYGDNFKRVENVWNAIRQRLLNMTNMKSFARVLLDIIILTSSPKLTPLVEERINSIGTPTAKCGTQHHSPTFSVKTI